MKRRLPPDFAGWAVKPTAGEEGTKRNASWKPTPCGIKGL